MCSHSPLRVGRDSGRATRRGRQQQSTREHGPGSQTGCRVCPDHDPCADCHVTESVSDTHRVEHDDKVYIHDRPALVKERRVVRSKDSEPNVRSVSTAES